MKFTDEEMGGMGGVHAAAMKTLKRGDFFKLDVPTMRLYLQTRFDEEGNYKKEA